MLNRQLLNGYGINLSINLIYIDQAEIVFFLSMHINLHIFFTSRFVVDTRFFTNCALKLNQKGHPIRRNYICHTPCHANLYNNIIIYLYSKCIDQLNPWIYMYTYAARDTPRTVMYSDGTFRLVW